MFERRFTYPRADGNRWLSGKTILSPQPQVYTLPTQNRSPRWLLTHLDSDLDSDFVYWVVVYENGDTQALRQKRDLLSAPETVSLTPNKWTHNTPPELVLSQGQLQLELPPPPPETALFPPLPDAPLLITTGNIPDLWLTQPTSRYAHNVLGDGIEAEAVFVRGTSLEIAPPDVIEATVPLWGDLDGDGTAELLLTLSNSRSGARFVSYSTRTPPEILAESEPIGRGFRWRHGIAIAPLGLGGEPELVSVRTPHLGGVVTYFRQVDRALIKVAELPGYSSHVLGSNNLDMAMTLDVDGDERPELLVPTQNRRALAALSRTSTNEAGVELLWQVELDSPLRTNLAAVKHEEHGFVGFVSDKKLYVLTAHTNS